MSPWLQMLALTLTVVLAAACLVWLISIVKRDAGVADVFWGVGFVIAAWTSWLFVQPQTLRCLFLVGLTTLWGLRLASFLFLRNRQHAEDRRYAAMRKSRGDRFWWESLFSVFLLQGILLWFISLPIQSAVAANSSAPLGLADLLGGTLWLIGFIFEAVGDGQLARFKADPRNEGRVMDRGLWRYTRHPNYFGDFCVWWGLYLIAAAGGGGWTIGSPLLISFLLLRVSGVTLLESTITERRPDYAAYQARTNAFFPGPPRAR